MSNKYDPNGKIDKAVAMMTFCSFSYMVLVCAPALYFYNPFGPDGLDNLAKIGSYLSGVLNPIVLVWLMVGYAFLKQQITKSDDSLELTRKSLDHQIAVYEADKLERYRSNQPNFIDIRIAKYHLDHGLGTSNELNGKAVCKVHLTNLGNDISQVFIQNNMGYCCSEIIPFIKRDSTAQIKTGIDYFLPDECEAIIPFVQKCWLCYKDSSGFERYAYLHIYWTPFSVEGHRLPQAHLSVGETPDQYSNENRNLDKESEYAG